MVDQSFFKSVPALAGLSAEQSATLASHVEVASHDDGHVFIEEGQTGSDAFFVIEGNVSVTRMKGADQRIKELNRMAPREIFGIISLIDHKERTSTCRAYGAVKVAKLSRESFGALRDQHPAVALHLERIIACQMSRDHKFLSDEIRDVIFSGNAVDALQSKDGLVIMDTYKGRERRSGVFSGYNGPERRGSNRQC